mgnify:CR=1 FL=1
MWAVVPFCIYYNTSENRTQDFSRNEIFPHAFVQLLTIKTLIKNRRRKIFFTKNFCENLPVFHNVFTKCPCGILEGFGDVPQQAFLKFISEIALMCTAPVSSEMGECVHKCVACYSEKRGFFGGLSPATAYRRVCAGSNQYRQILA